eukprot:gene20153-biopygen6546
MGCKLTLETSSVNSGKTWSAYWCCTSLGGGRVVVMFVQEGPLAGGLLAQTPPPPPWVPQFRKHPLSCRREP